MDNTSDREILERLLKLEQENYKILKALRSSQRWGVFWGFIKFLLLVVLPLIFAYFYLQPYLDSIMGTYNQIQGQVNTLQKVTGQVPDISSILKQLDSFKPR